MIAELGLAALWLAAALAALQMLAGALAVRAGDDDAEIAQATRPAAVVQGVLAGCSFLALLWVFADAGMGWDFAAWISVHGTTELGAIMLSGAAGLHIGRNMAFPGDRSVLAAASAAGRRAAQVMAGCVIMLIVAGLLEGFVRQLVGNTGARFTIGGAMLAFWIVYFTLVRTPRRDHGELSE